MTIKKATEINAKLIKHGMAQIIPVTEPQSLKDISLQDMLEAMKKIKELPNEVTKNENGSTTTTTMHMSVDERLIAALYAVNNYEGGSPSAPNLIAKSDNKILLVIDLDLAKEEVEDED